MKILEYGCGREPSLVGCVVALGFFDGVHLAHRELIRTAVREAEKRGCKSVVLTFPAESETLKSRTPRIYTTSEKLAIITALGVDYTVLADFDSIAGLSAMQFVKDVLVDKLGALCAVAGYNYRFGNGAKGDSEELTRLMRLHGREVIILGEYLYEGAPLSSTLIRKALAEGRIDDANRMLGAPYRISGRVIHGNGNGSGFGFPTVNTDIGEFRALPRLGVYRTVVPIGGRLYTGVTNVGKCPTFGERKVHAETYIVDFDGDLYGEDIEMFILGFLRDEKRFSGLSELQKQINIDKTNALLKNNEDLEKHKWTEIGLS